MVIIEQNFYFTRMLEKMLKTQNLASAQKFGRGLVWDFIS